MTDDASGDDIGAPRRRTVRSSLRGSRALVRLVYRDPEHVAERLTLYAAAVLGPQSLAWAQEVRRTRPDVPRLQIGEELRTRSAQIARIDGAIAGTPFYLALVPGYVNFLWQEARMTLRTAALYDRDPCALGTSAELLALRGVHETVDAAEAALLAVRDRPLPERPAERRRLRTWVDSVYRLLIFGGFMSAPSHERDAETRRARARLRTIAGIVIGTVVWVMTWVLPLTFMVVMAWGCESHARQLGLRTLALYDGEAATSKAAIRVAAQHHDRGHGWRQVLRATALALSVAIPIGFVAYANHVRQSTGVSWLAALGGLVALALILATVVIGRRR
jgi:hypothetical protein